MQGKLSIPSKYKDAQDSWKKNHPGYSFTVWDEEDLEKLIQGTFWTQLINKCTTLIQRADIYRCAVLEREGGVYVDMDMYALKSIEPLLLELDISDTDISVGQTSFYGTPFHSLLAVNNAWISARKHSIFWKTKYFPLILFSLHQYTLLDMLSPVFHVLKTAGPGAWTTLAQDAKEFIKILPQEYFYSLKKVKKSLLSTDDIELLKPLSYGYHRQDSGWMKSWESILIQCFIGNNWKYTGVLLFLFFYFVYVLL
jgi:mannosyltransferase OCH1-like enzyme